MRHSFSQLIHPGFKAFAGVVFFHRQALGIIFFWLLAGFVCFGACLRLGAAEYNYNFSYNGTNYANKLWHDNSTTNVQGVIIHFNYAAGAGLYANANWQNFARARNLAMLLTLNQDYIQTTADGLAIVSNTLVSVAGQSGHTELTNWQPYIFTGLSRGGGGPTAAIAQGWAAGRNRTIACVGYHGNSLINTLYASTTDAKAIPVLYLIGSFDAAPVQPAPDTRQADVEDWVRQGVLYGYSLRLNGALWTTSMQYGVAHNNTGNDTYVLQWLGRVMDVRLNNNNRGTLNGIVLNDCRGINYTMVNPNTTNCAFAGISLVTSFLQSSKMIWIPPGGESEWLWENTMPRILSLTNYPGQIYPGQTNHLSLTASDPNGEPLSYHWTLQSGPAGGTAVFGNNRAASTTVVLGPGPGLYTLQVEVADTAVTNTGNLAITVFAPPVLSCQRSGSNFVLSGVNGLPGIGYAVLVSPDVSLPLANWNVLVTNPFGPEGRFIFTNAMDDSAPQRFFRLKLP